MKHGGRLVIYLIKFFNERVFYLDITYGKVRRACFKILKQALSSRSRGDYLFSPHVCTVGFVGS